MHGGWKLAFVSGVQLKPVANREEDCEKDDLEVKMKPVSTEIDTFLQLEVAGMQVRMSHLMKRAGDDIVVV